MKLCRGEDYGTNMKTDTQQHGEQRETPRDGGHGTETTDNGGRDD